MSCDRESVVDLPQALKWIEKFSPKSDVHITGGEPFVLPEMVDGISLFVNAGHRTSVFTNGSLLSKYPEAYSLPVAWQITHHDDQIPTDNFMSNIAPLQGKPCVVCRIIGKNEESVPGIENLYPGFEFRWIRDRAGFIGYNLLREYAPCPNDEMLFIGIHGEVFSCSTDNRQYGNIYDMTFDMAAAREYVCPGGYPDNCQACQSIDILNDLHERSV